MAKKPAARIVGTGRAVPETVLTNADLERIVDTSDEWITTRTGIKERRVVAEGEALVDLVERAGRAAMEDAGVDPLEVDLLILATATVEQPIPASSAIVQPRLGVTNAACFDLSAACSGFTYSVNVARQFIATGGAETVLVVGAETLSKITNWKDRSTCVLFGDSAGAVVVRPSEPGQGFLSFYLGADGGGAALISQPAGGSRLPASYETVERAQHTLHMNGREVYKFAVRVIPRAIEEALRRASLTLQDVDMFIPHQANIRIIDAAAERLGQPREKFFINVERYGNTSSASVPVALYEAVRAGLIHRGDLAVLVAFGGGLTWGSTALRWTK